MNFPTRSTRLASAGSPSRASTRGRRSLPHHHRDPFDRLLVAQALTERHPLVSNATKLDAYGIERLW
jgi:PIN domain nuclease of toxin-antitoxin system